MRRAQAINSAAFSRVDALSGALVSNDIGCGMARYGKRIFWGVNNADKLERSGWRR